MSAQKPSSAPPKTVTWQVFVSDFTAPLAAGNVGLGLDTAVFAKYSAATVVWSGTLIGPTSEEGKAFDIGMPARLIKVNGNDAPTSLDRITVSPDSAELEAWRKLKPGVPVRFRASTNPFGVLILNASQLKSPPPGGQPKVVMVVFTGAKLVTAK
jgi:hypothetical protein